MPPSTAGAAARLAADRAHAAGVDPAPLLRKAGLPLGPIQDRNVRIDATAQISFLNLVAEALPDELLGFHLAEGFELREAGLLYFVLASSATLGEALARAERYSTIANEGILLRYGLGEDLHVRYSYVGMPRHADRHQMEFWATALVRICRRLTGIGLNPIRISLDHPRCGASDRLATYFGCEVTFAAGLDEVAFPRNAAPLALAGAEPYLNELLVRYCEDALAQRGRILSPIRTGAENAIAPLLPHGKARADEVARVLGMSRRTLARRLAAEDLSFARIQDDMRRDLARQYLKDATLSVSQVAWLVGFQEVGAFTHAFRRWTGLTPTEARRR
jgi:AraC-like DNA-binding protein